MSRVWSCNEWDPLEEVIVGNPLNARYPTPDRSSQFAEFSDRSLAEIPRGPFPQQVIEETEEDLNEFVPTTRTTTRPNSTLGQNDLRAVRGLRRERHPGGGSIRRASPLWALLKKT